MPTVESAEQRFLAYATSRDPEVLDGLVREHADQAYTLARRMLGHVDLAEDAVQEACVRLVATADRYRGDIAFAAWFGRLVSSASIDQRRRAQSRRRRVAGAARVVTTTPVDAEAGDDAQLEALRGALADLPERFREPLSLYYFAGLDQAGVASALKLPAGTVASRLSRGLRRLRLALTKVGIACTVAAIGDLLGGMPAYAASPELATAMVKAAATPAPAAATSAGATAWIGSLVAALALVALVAVGVAVAATRRVAPVASAIDAVDAARGLVAAMPPGSWRAAPGTPMRAVLADRAAFPAIQSIVGAASVIESWSGGALDTRRDRLLVWGGGASNYAGNELYAFDLPALAWRRLTDPYPRLEPRGQEINPDGTPKARATYNGLAYLAHADRLFAYGGDLAVSDGNVRSGSLTWEFDPAANRWSHRAGPPSGSDGGFGRACAYDPASRRLWWCGGEGLWSYDHDADRWTRHDDSSAYYLTAAVDTRRGRLVLVGGGTVSFYQLGDGDLVRRAWPTTGGEAFIAAGNVGLDYDPVGDRIVGWDGGAVHALDPESGVWTATSALGAPRRTGTGIFGRWRYVPDLDAFVVVTSVDDDVHFFKPLR